ncbi:hypothetical protein DB42_AQ00540 [Neochlamydia sp. EPS4]|uniref:hypothetical protein n=1 Tax=Neochlamydia sp. EPS4 TaxID=1478175 RepID=UPI000584000C|nr:hypothetical protein [Neochlamydia sp. EPS4]KIC75074.1 hypothetical protein DB42_AQ00540 [Neochlamydia sp. EPS4]
MSIFSAQPIFQTLPMTQPMVQTLSNTSRVFQTFPKTELISQSLPNAELISRLLPKAKPISQSLWKAEPISQSLWKAEPISQSLWKAEQISQPLLKAEQISQLFSEIKPMSLTSEMECPFAWKSESYPLNKLIQFFPSGAKLTISFTTTRSSKVLGYVPIIGTAMGIFRIYKGIQEYRFFNSIHLHSLTARSFKWMARGAFESIPVLGGLICLIMDIISTILSKESSGILSNFEEETPCGYCHQCGYCNC